MERRWKRQVMEETSVVEKILYSPQKKFHYVAFAIHYQKTGENQRNYRRNFPSVIITDRNNSVSKSVGIYRRPKPVGETVGIYRRHISVGIYRQFRRRGIQFFLKYATAWWRQMILPTELPRDSNWDSRTVTWHCHRRNHRWNHRRITSVGDSIGKNHYMPTYLPTLSSSVSPSSSFPSHLSPPKLQLPSQTAAKHPSQLSTILNTSTQVSYILYVVTISVSCRFYHFFVSKSILFSFNF